MKRHRIDWKPTEWEQVFTEAKRLLDAKDGINWTKKKIFMAGQAVLAPERHRPVHGSILYKFDNLFKAWLKENRPTRGRPVGSFKNKNPALGQLIPRPALSFCPACGTAIGLCSKCGLDLRKLHFGA